MKGFAPLFKKEIREQFKLYRLVIVGAIFLFFALSSPLTLKYLPDILKMAGEQSMIIQLPTPDGGSCRFRSMPAISGKSAR